MMYSEIEDSALLALTQEQFKSAHRIFYERVQSGQLMCSIYNIFAQPGSPNHNCLGCNFDEMTDQISKFLYACTVSPGLFLPQQSFAIYAMLLNVVWERVCDIFMIISLPDSYLVRYFGAFIRVRRWANFFKHPKAFAWMVHHPEYTFERTEHSNVFLNDATYLRIDDEFVKSYYAAEKPKGLTRHFEGKENRVVVILPNLETLTSDVCDCLQRFVEVVTQNQVYKEILDEKSTFAN